MEAGAVVQRCPLHRLTRDRILPVDGARRQADEVLDRAGCPVLGVRSSSRRTTISPREVIIRAWSWPLPATSMLGNSTVARPSGSGGQYAHGVRARRYQRGAGIAVLSGSRVINEGRCRMSPPPGPASLQPPLPLPVPCEQHGRRRTAGARAACSSADAGAGPGSACYPSTLRPDPCKAPPPCCPTTTTSRTHEQYHHDDGHRFGEHREALSVTPRPKARARGLRGGQDAAAFSDDVDGRGR